ncbi:general substrate transporter [Punctularia strigosozonata HHB-11173 SS5]|uniref:general substrate transporter n=1 Tax=Punctularia strigosozonata (strain HHB-11173) TaxID=741275 RepID=UPI0004417275|nr:general substrate transporter [Punctularia strigosozonata HHB-11173 SS5]EIN05725.1 general substrate transporter [Punctularia strigosozonata HHB-11173 SS5]
MLVVRSAEARPLTACCCQGFLLLGYDQGVMSGIIGADNQFGRDFGHPDATDQGFIVPFILTQDIGCVVGSLIIFVWGETIGRKRSIMSGASIMLVGTAILTSSTTRAQLYVGRIVTGIGNGFNSSSIPVYQSETCGGHIRGALVCLNSTITILGLVIAYWLDYGMSFVEGPSQWRLPIGFQAVFALCLLLQATVLPDSPRWLMAHDKEEEATRIIAALLDKDHLDDPEVLEMKKEIEVSLAQESSGGPFRYSELLDTGRIGNLRRICLAIGINVMQQFTGSNMINYLAPVVYQNTMGLSRNLSLLLGGATSCTYLVASFIPLWTVDRYGRRTLLMVSATGLSFCFVMAAIFLSIGTKGTAFAATAMVFIFQIFLGIGFLPIPWLYPAEVATTRIRARASAISSAINWACVFAVVEMTPPAIQNISWRVFIIFAVFNALWVPLVYIFFPETKGLELEDVDHLFDKGGLTGGVWSSPGGRTVERHAIFKDMEKSPTEIREESVKE